MICEVCQQAVPNKVSRGPLMATDQPPRVYFNGEPLLLAPSEARFLTHLIRFVRASGEALAARCSGEDVEDALRQMRIVLVGLRKRLPAGVSIRVIRAWGYELILDETART